MSKIKIEKNIPMPNNGHGNSIYPWDEMEIGDSFFTKADSISAGCSAKNQRDTSAKKWICRKEGDGHRVWRVK